MKDVKKLLTEQANAVLPDKKVKQNIMRELGMEQAERSLAYAHGGEKAEKNKKTLLIAAAAVFAAAALFLAIFLPVFLGRGKTGVGGGKFADITDADSFYAYGAASVGALLSVPGENGASGVKLLSFAQKDAAQDAHIETVNRYMALVEGLLSEESISETAIAGADGYDFGMTVHLSGISGGGADYTLYYNKIFRGSETDEDETQESYSIEGILIAAGGQYSVEGNYETESERGEAESELYFKAYTGENSYIDVRQESETEAGDDAETEIEYVYTVYENGRVAERTTVEYESEEGELELLLSINREGVRDTLLFKEESENGERILSASGEIGGQKVRFRVYIRGGQYHYVFEDGSSEDHDRYEDDDDDDD